MQSLVGRGAGGCESGAPTPSLQWVGDFPPYTGSAVLDKALEEGPKALAAPCPQAQERLQHLLLPHHTHAPTSNTGRT